MSPDRSAASRSDKMRRMRGARAAGIRRASPRSKNARSPLCLMTITSYSNMEYVILQSIGIDDSRRTMIEHLRGRDRKLEPLGWTGQDAEWIALVCLHSGVFRRAQFCHYFDTDRKRALRFVKALVERRAAVEGEGPIMNGGGKTCRISSKLIYRALGVEDIRHRRKASKPVVMRRLLSLDFVLEHPGMNWLPAEPEKVEFFEKLGLPRRLIPGRIYCGVVGNQKR